MHTNRCFGELIDFMSDESNKLISQFQGTSVSNVGENLPYVNPAINGKVSAWLQSQEPDLCAQGTAVFLNTSEMVIKEFISTGE